jgi:hypothetical protein
VAEVHFVEIRLEDFVFRESQLDHHRQRNFRQLAAECSIRGKEAHLRELLRDRAATFSHAARFHVGDYGATNSDRIDSDVTSEACVFSCEEGVRHVVRQIAKRDWLCYAPIAAVQCDQSLPFAVEDFSRCPPRAGTELGYNAVAVPP